MTGGKGGTRKGKAVYSWELARRKLATVCCHQAVMDPVLQTALIPCFMENNPIGTVTGPML